MTDAFTLLGLIPAVLLAIGAGWLIQAGSTRPQDDRELAGIGTPDPGGAAD